MFSRRILSTFSVSVRHASTGTIGFVGLGQMGAYMAANLAKKGSQVIVYDIMPQGIDAVKSEAQSTGNLKIAKNLSELVKVSALDTVVTMLPASPQVREVYLGENGLLPSVKKSGILFLDSTTGDPAMSKEVAAAAEAKGCIYMDAPVSGGVVAARDALLTFMLGGHKKHVERAQKVLLLMGKNVVHCGDVGTGEAAKICNNMLLAISMIGTSEAFHLGKQLGLSPEVLARVINSSSGRCWSSEIYNPVPGVVPGVPSSRDYKGGFVCRLMAKDLGLAQSASQSVDVPIPLGGMALQIYRLLTKQGMGDLDFGVIYKYLSENKK